MMQLRLTGTRPLGLAMGAGALSAFILGCGSESVSTIPSQGGSGSLISRPGPTGGSGATNPSDVTGGSPPLGSECLAGNERCACYGNGTCNAGLVCASGHCVNVSGLIPGTGGALSTGGATGNTGGATAAGATSVATGGFPATGGNSSVTSTGGANNTGGSFASGGAAASGGMPSTGGMPGTGGVSFWKNVTYNASGLPNPSNGNHNAGQNCIQCHSATAGNSEAPVWLFGGTVYQANGTTPAAHVQVGINDGANLYTAYSATNGNFWFGGTGKINWASAQVRIRNANGELIMAGATPASTCNLCHNGSTYPRITAP